MWFRAWHPPSEVLGFRDSELPGHWTTTRIVARGSSAVSCFCGRCMGEVTHTTVLNKISDDEERKIAIMWHIEPTHVWWGGKNLRNCDIILAQSCPTRGWWWGASVPARSRVSSVEHKNGPIPSHKASQNFSIRPFDSKLNFRKSIFYRWNPYIHIKWCPCIY